MNYPEFYNIISAEAHSRKEYMFIGLYGKMCLNPEGIICKIAPFSLTIPKGRVSKVSLKALPFFDIG
jgi:hypothetical protein